MHNNLLVIDQSEYIKDQPMPGRGWNKANILQSANGVVAGLTQSYINLMYRLFKNKKKTQHFFEQLLNISETNTESSLVTVSICTVVICHFRVPPLLAK